MYRLLYAGGVITDNADNAAASSTPTTRTLLGGMLNSTEAAELVSRETADRYSEKIITIPVTSIAIRYNGATSGLVKRS